MAASKSGMELAPMKQLLNKAAPDNPIPFAFGMGAEPGFALLMLDKAGKNPKGVLKSLEEDFKDAKNTRWGTAVVEPERASLVKFIVNKPVSGMAKRLVKTLKGTGYNKAEIVLEDGTVVEGATEEEDEGAVAVAPGAPPPPAAGQTPEEKAAQAADLAKKLATLIPRIGPAGAAQPAMLDQLKKFATDANVNIKTGNLIYAATAITQLATALDKIAPAGTVPPPPPGPPPAPGQPTHDAADLSKKLGELIPRIGPAGTAQPAMLDQLKKFATDANVNIKTNNLVYAATAIAQLAAALDKAASGTASGGAPASASAFATSSKIWASTHQRMTADIEKLRAELVSTYQAEGIAADVEKAFTAVVTPLLTTFDGSLATKLDEAGKATDPAVRSQLVGEAQEILTRYTAALSNPVIADLDTNPFVPLSIQKTLSATLTGLSAAIR